VGLSAPGPALPGGFGRPSGKRQKAIARGAVSFPLGDKRTPVPDCPAGTCYPTPKEEPRHVSLLPFSCIARDRSPPAGRPGIDTERKAFSFVIQVTNGTGQSGSSPPRPFGVKPGRPLSCADRRLLSRVPGLSDCPWRWRGLLVLKPFIAEDERRVVNLRSKPPIRSRPLSRCEKG
jgi:hypothetical protein